MRSIGRLLQLAGLGLPVVAIILQIAGILSVGKMLIAAVAAISMFYIGRLVEGYSSP